MPLRAMFHTGKLQAWGRVGPDRGFVCCMRLNWKDSVTQDQIESTELQDLVFSLLLFLFFCCLSHTEYSKRLNDGVLSAL